MKKMMKVLVTWDFDHEKDSLGEAIGADYEKARKMAVSTANLKRSSQAIEKIIFDNNESLQTRVLAVFIAGTLKARHFPIIALGQIKPLP